MHLQGLSTKIWSAESDDRLHPPGHAKVTKLHYSQFPSCLMHVGNEEAISSLTKSRPPSLSIMGQQNYMVESIRAYQESDFLGD